MWSLIPWRRVITLVTPFMKEVFIGKFNLLGYFFTNKVVTILFITLVCNYLAFQYVLLGYDDLYEKTLSLDKQNKIYLVKIGELQSQLTTLGTVAQPKEDSVLTPEPSGNSEDHLYKQALYEIIRLKQQELRHNTEAKE